MFIRLPFASTSSTRCAAALGALTLLTATLAGCGRNEPAAAMEPTEPPAPAEPPATAPDRAPAEPVAPAPERPAEGPSGVHVEVARLQPRPASTAEKLTWPEVGAKPDDFVGRVGRCELLLAPTPVAISSHERATAAEQTSEALDDRRAVFFCRNGAEGLQSTPVVVWFPEGEKGALLDLDRESVAAIQLAGTLAGQPSAVFRGQVGGGKRPPPAEGLADLLSALIWPEKLQGQRFRCRSTGLATPVKSGADDASTRALVGGELADRRGQLRCIDARGGSVGVAAYLPKGRAGELLAIARDTEVELTLKGFAMNQLIARFEKVVAGGAKIDGEGAELRRFLVESEPLIGKSVACRVLIAPSPARGGALLDAGRRVIRTPIDAAYTAVACAAPDGNVPAVVFFPDGKADAMLRIGGDTRVEISLWGVEAGRILAHFEGIAEAGVAAPGPTDWRRLALDPTPQRGKHVACEVLIPPFVGSSRSLVSEKHALLDNAELDDPVAVLGCKDATGAVGGTRVEAYFTKGQGAAAAGITAGSTVTLEVRGTVAGVVVTRWPGSKR